MSVERRDAVLTGARPQGHPQNGYMRAIASASGRSLRDRGFGARFRMACSAVKLWCTRFPLNSSRAVTPSASMPAVDSDYRASKGGLVSALVGATSSDEDTRTALYLGRGPARSSAQDQ